MSASSHNREPISLKPQRSRQVSRRVIITSLVGLGSVCLCGGYPFYEKLFDHHILTYAEHSGWVIDAAWSPDGKYIVSSSSSGDIKIWEAATGKTWHTCMRKYAMPSLLPAKVSWSSDGKYVHVYIGDHYKYPTFVPKQISIWEAVTGKYVDTMYMPELSTSPYGEFAKNSKAGNYAWNEEHIAEFTTKHIFIWDMWSGEKVKTLPTNFPDKTYNVGMQWSPDGKKLLTYRCSLLETSAEIRLLMDVWNLVTNQTVTMMGPVALNARMSTPITDIQAQWSPDSKQIAFFMRRSEGKERYRCEIWDAETGEKLKALTLTYGSGGGMKWSFDGKYLAVHNEIFDAQSGKRVTKYGISGDLQYCWSPNSYHIAVCEEHRFNGATFGLIDALSGEAIYTYRKELVFKDERVLGRPVWSPNGKTILLVGERINMWES